MDSYKCASGIGLEHLYGMERAVRMGEPPDTKIEDLILRDIDVHVRGHKPCAIIYTCIAKHHNRLDEAERIKSGTPYEPLRGAKE